MTDFGFVNTSNINYIASINNRSKDFNLLNKNFISEYNTKKVLGKLALRRKCILIKKDNKFIGFIWVSSFRESICFVNELYIEDDMIEGNLPNIINLFSKYSTVNYTSIKNRSSDLAISSLGFSKSRAITTLILDKACYKFHGRVNTNKATIEFYKEGKDELIRCKIQNDIFRSPNRKDLVLQDILADEVQGYYIRKGALFIKKDDIYVGYGQIIWDKGYITIVNLGIIPEYRGQGFGQILLNEIINLSIIMFPHEKEIKIDVFDNNIAAIALYLKLGFKEKLTINYWKIGKKI